MIRIDLTSTLLTILTFCIDFSKSTWNKYLPLFLLHYNFSVSEIGIIKSKSLVCKTFFQVLVPILEDMGVFSVCIPRTTSSHILIIFSLLLSIPLYMNIAFFATTRNIFMIVALKSTLSSLSAITSLTDSVVSRTVQKRNLLYSTQQFTHLTAWSIGALAAGVLIDWYGHYVIVPVTIFPKIVAVMTLICLAVHCPLDRSIQSKSGIDLTVFTNVKNVIISDRAILIIIFSASIWGACFVVIETITIFQLKQKFGFSNTHLGYTSIFTLIGGLPLYYHTKHIVKIIGAENLIFTGIYSAVVFLLSHCLLSHDTVNAAFILCSLRAFSYACVWAGMMDIFICRIDADMITSVQSMINICWFTIGGSCGYTAWMYSYTKYGAQQTYLACALVMTLTLFVQVTTMKRRVKIALYLLICIFYTFTTFKSFNVSSYYYNRVMAMDLQNIRSTVH